IRDAQDALILFEAVRLNVLPLITRRLNGNERAQLKSGNIFVWEESESKGGLSRWTDGRRWSQSRMRGDFLWYEEQIEMSQEERDAKAARRARKALDPTIPSVVRRQDRPAKTGGFIKQTYSTLVRHISGCRKWHIVAYFSGDDYMRLPVIAHYEYLRRLRVPDGIFLPGKASTRKLELSESMAVDETTPSWSANTDDDHTRRRTNSNNSQGTEGSLTSSPRSSASPKFTSLPVPSPHPTRERMYSLPALALVAPRSPSGPSPTAFWNAHDSAGVKGGYHPRSSEDRKALESFRITL
ncbi:hypothetical protein BDM02DRAFT_3104934, partial [Thelephora ganbajun]